MNPYIELFIFLFASVGATFIITLSKLFSPIRKLAERIHSKIGQLFKCPMCIGVWVGWFIQAILMLYKGSFSDIGWEDSYLILYGFVSSFFAYAFYLLLKPLIEKYD